MPSSCIMQATHMALTPQSKIIAAALAFLAVYVMPTPGGLTPAGQGVLAVAACAFVMWTTEAVPLGLSALVVVVLLTITGSGPRMEDARGGLGALDRFLPGG